ncbi:MAG: translation elongation factor 4 [bacterium]
MGQYNADNIRNFSIIAHIDHGKSTLADRLLEATGALTKREMQSQVLDTLEIERERGITIKAQTVRLNYKADDGKEYVLNLIDTPGHVDFTYEVSRSLAACEGAVLVVDASQGVEAQTLANVYMALDANLQIVSVINKIDLPSADVENAKKEIEEVIGIDASEAIPASAKEGIGIHEILEAVVQKVPPPKDTRKDPLQVLIMDSWYDNYQGVVLLARVMAGTIRVGDRVFMMYSNETLKNDSDAPTYYQVVRLGYLTPKFLDQKEANPGEVIFLVCNIKSIRDVRIGDTITHTESQTDPTVKYAVASEPLQGFKEVKPVVFSGIFPTDSKDFENLKEALQKLSLNDAALTFEPENSLALGFGFRCGYLGLLHMEIVQERLEREFGMNIISTAPGVRYKVTKTNGETFEVDNPALLPKPHEIEKIEEPMIRGIIHTPAEYVGAIITICEARRGTQERIDYITKERCAVVYKLPLGEMLFDFYDKLKSISKGYASFDYELLGLEESQLVKLDVMINGDVVDALSVIVHRTRSYERGRDLTKKMKEVIPRQQYEVAIQASIGTKVIARETVGALRKNVLAKCYGGDISRKRKLLEKQKEGKKRMKSIGTVEVPQEAFLAILKIE